MKYLFFQTAAKAPNATHTRNSDGVSGYFREISDSATITGPLTRLLDSKDGFTLIPPSSPAPPVSGARVPQSIANWRAKAALELAGLTIAVETAMQALDEPARTVALSAWSNGADLARRGATVLALAAALELTEEQVDALFVTGASLTV